MTSRSTRVMLALVTVFALTAITASAASAALPEFKPVPTKKKFTSTSSTVVFALATSSITCSKSAIAGEITGTSTIGKTVATFTGCELKASGCEGAVQSLGAKAGEIVTKSLKGELGTVNAKQAASGVGLLLEPETKTPIATFPTNACLGEGQWNGNLAGEITPTGKKQLASKLVFAGAGDKMNIKTIIVKRGEVSPALDESWFGTTMGITASNEIVFEEALEIT